MTSATTTNNAKIALPLRIYIHMYVRRRVKKRLGAKGMSLTIHLTPIVASAYFRVFAVVVVATSSWIAKVALFTIAARKKNKTFKQIKWIIKEKHWSWSNQGCKRIRFNTHTHTQTNIMQTKAQARTHIFTYMSKVSEEARATAIFTQLQKLTTTTTSATATNNAAVWPATHLSKFKLSQFSIKMNRRDTPALQLSIARCCRAAFHFHFWFHYFVLHDFHPSAKFYLFLLHLFGFILI